MSFREAIKSPRTAWPTVALSVAAFCVALAAMLGAGAGVVSLPAAACLVFVAAFVAFTPMHDASHRSVSRHRWLNEFVGRLSSLVLAAPFAAFRYVHLEHHRHTNDPELDPDHYAGRGPRWSLPLRWLTQDFHYYIRVIRHWRSRPRAERLEVVINVVVLASLIGGLTALGHGLLVALVWLAPARLAIGALSFAFDYLPHVPHQVRATEDRYAATRIIEAPGLTVLFLQQNYHLIHHLYPGVPFYRYRRIYRLRENELRGRGAIVTRWPLRTPRASASSSPVR